MFLGQETYVREWAQKFEKVGLVKNESNVNSAVTRLEKAGIINEIKRLENKRGVPVIRTSNFQSFFSLIKVAKPEIEQETLERIKEYIKGFGKAIHFFPDYIQMTYDISGYNIKKLKWPMIAATYLNFLLGLLIFINKEEKFDAKEYAEVTNEISEIEKSEKYFNPLREALEKIPKDLYDKISKRHYQDDVLLLAELANLILYGPKYKFIKNTVGYAARKKLAAYYKNDIK
jgi:hypothetical protein